jgi:hypothetical protein
MELSIVFKKRTLGWERKKVGRSYKENIKKKVGRKGK